MGQAFAELDVCKTHKGAKVESMESWKKGQDKGSRVVVFVQGEAAFVRLFATMAIYERARLTV